MGKVYDTTDFVGTSITKKSKLGKNFEIGENYWLESLQYDINKKWFYAADRVDVEEENQKLNDKKYIKANTHYNKIEARLNQVYDDHGKQLSPDFKELIFREIDHPTRLGKKYRFDQEDFSQTDLKEKDVWLTINKNITDLTSSVILKRCNGLLGFLVNGGTEEWYEPVSLDYDPKYTIQYLNQVINVPSAQVYVTAQFNEYTKSIAINDRFILGAIDFDNKFNNSAFKVKGVFRLGTLEKNNPNSIPLVMLALEADVVNETVDYIEIDEDGKYHFIADYYNYKNQKDNNYDVPYHERTDEDYYLKILSDDSIVYEGQNKDFVCNLYNAEDELVEAKVNFTLSLDGPTNPENYFSSWVVDDNTIRIFNKKKYFRSDLILTCSLDSEEYSVPNFIYKIQLGDVL